MFPWASLLTKGLSPIDIARYCDIVELWGTPSTPGLLDLDTVWEPEQGADYTNKVNWLRIGEDPQPVNGPYVLAELRFSGPGPFGFALVSYSTIGLVYGQDADPDNNHAESPPLYITVLGGP